MTKRLTNVDSQEGISQFLLWTVRVGILLVLVSPLIVTTSTLFPFVVGKAIFARAVIEITLAFWLILVFFYPRHRPSRSWILITLSVWLLVSLIASFTGVSSVRSLWSNFERMQGVIDQAHWLAFILIASSVFRKISNWRLLFTINLGVAGLVSTLGLSQHYGQLNFEWLERSERMGSTLGSAAFMGVYTMANFIIGLGLILQSLGRNSAEPTQQEFMSRTSLRYHRSKREYGLFNALAWFRGFWLVASLLCLWSLWLTASRGALVCIGIGAVIFAVGSIRCGTLQVVRRVAYSIIAIILVAGTFIMVASFTPLLDSFADSSTMLRRLDSQYQGPSVDNRILSIEAGIRAYQDKPIFGWGPENYLIPWGRYLEADTGFIAYFDQAHSKVIEELVTKGTIGLLSYLLIWLALISVLVRSVKHRQSHDQLLTLALMATLIVLFVQNLFLSDSPTTTMQLAFLVAFVVSEEGWIRDKMTNIANSKRPRIHIARHIRMRSVKLSQRLRQLQMFRQLHTAWGEALVILVIVTSTIWVLINYNVGSYNAAQAAKNSYISTSWMETVSHFNESVDKAPALANLPRRLLGDKIGSNITFLTNEEYMNAVELITIEGQKALEDEPQNWLLHVKLAEFYQQAASRNSELVEVAKVHVNEATRLAPNTYYTIEVIESQQRLEGIANCEGFPIRDHLSNPELVRDCETLLAIRDTLAGDAILNWSHSETLSNWDGIIVGDSPRRVTGLHLRSFGLNGTISPRLADLEGLVTLHLPDNRLTSTIPPELGKLTNLRELILSKNLLLGEIPRELGGLVNLRQLWLKQNLLSGPIPITLQDLHELNEIRLRRNQLDGCIPMALLSIENSDLIFLELPTCNVN